jgi:cytochrome c-type biogenesis protein CcmE
MKARHKRLALVLGGVAVLAVAAGLVLSAFQDNLVFFYSPSEVAEGKAPQGRSFRIGGLVELGSIQRQEDGVTVAFAITDTARAIPVRYKGILPDLFKEGKGAVAEGKFGADGVFSAEKVLAKHDENYMPPEAQHAVDKAAQAAERSAKSMGGGYGGAK